MHSCKNAYANAHNKRTQQTHMYQHTHMFADIHIAHLHSYAAVTYTYICDKINSFLRLLVPEEVVLLWRCNPPSVNYAI